MDDKSEHPTITYYKKNPTIKHLLGFPVFSLYLIDLMLALAFQSEIIALLCILIAFFHAVALLFTYWNVKFAALTGYSKIDLNSFVKKDETISVDNLKSLVSHALVVPLQHLGKPELIAINYDQTMPYFMFQKLKFIWNGKEFSVVPSPVNMKISKYLSATGFTAKADIEETYSQFGKNEIDIPMPTFVQLFKEHVLAPFFLFQIFSVILWCFDEYPQYGIMTLIMLIVSEAAVVKSRLFNMSYLRSMVDKNVPDVYVYRCKKWQRIHSYELLPHDIVSISAISSSTSSAADTKMTTIPADILIIAGQGVVNESMLNGESTPRIKESIALLGANEDDLDIDKHKNHMLFSGTQLILHTQDKSFSLKAPDGGAIGYVCRTGFSTSQGRLMRSIIYASERITVNSFEAFYFILFLLFFAIISASYVLKTCWNDTSRSRAKLLIYCANLLTSIVPVELPMELSLAVNASLQALKLLGIFCTESFRVPISGGVDICCFDKTGTLTSDKINLRGIVLCGKEAESIIQNEEEIKEEEKGEKKKKHKFHKNMVDPSLCPENSTYVIAGCHSLIAIKSKKHDKDELSYHGDPVEVAGIKGIHFHSEGDSQVVVAEKKNTRFKDVRITIIQRFPFSSALRRMSAIISIKSPGKEEQYKIVVKGAPEIIKGYLNNPSDDYDTSYLEYSKRGARVLAMAYRDLPALTIDAMRRMKREEVENNLTFCGFSIFECPAKADSKQAIAALRDSAHEIAMITGDNILTACYVAKKLNIVNKKLLCLKKKDDELFWCIDDGDMSNEAPLVPIPKYNEVLTKEQENYFEFCIDGSVSQYFYNMSYKVLDQLLNLTKVYARVTPEDKETILTLLKEHNHVTLMCGDGTNDVGALKQAHIGIALLNIDPKKSMPTPQQQLARQRQMQSEPRNISNEMFKQLAEQENTIQLGDASIASPFTCKSISVMPILNILRQGRCTLVTTHQMYKILASNSLINAYSMSVLYIAGVKMSDSQALVLGILIACCFLFISRSKPAEKLSKKRPLSKLLHPFMFISILAQFFVNFSCLFLAFKWTTAVPGSYLTPPELIENNNATLVNSTQIFNGTLPKDNNFAYLDADFSPNLVNSITCCQQIATFAVNYRGKPFMQSMTQNKGLTICLLSLTAITIGFVLEVSPDLNNMFKITKMPSDAFKYSIAALMLGNILLVFIVEFIVKKVCSLFVDKKIEL